MWASGNFLRGTLAGNNEMPVANADIEQAE